MAKGKGKRGGEGDVRNITAALVRAQQHIRNVGVDSSGESADGKAYRFVSLGKIMAGVRGPLSEQGLVISHVIETQVDSVMVRTILLHESGERMQTSLWIPVVVDRMNHAQAIGAASTYGRRYGVMALLGIVGDTDDDAKSAGRPGQRFGEGGYDHPYDNASSAVWGEDRPARPDGAELVGEATWRSLTDAGRALSPDQRELFESWRTMEEIDLRASKLSEEEAARCIEQMGRIAEPRQIDDEAAAEVRETPADEARRLAEDAILNDIPGPPEEPEAAAPPTRKPTRKKGSSTTVKEDEGPAPDEAEPAAENQPEA